ncbi:hypothetical protein ACN27F_21010 [Solwaraspora sp. WMMB335]|uniref:hypothetical protein n=1 Tax=Solwaraspora sp. WMMB335 TaxID=3404118 RepID=UPI003B95AA71
MAADVTEMIESGMLAPSDKPSSTAELADKYGVSKDAAYRPLSLLHGRDHFRGTGWYADTTPPQNDIPVAPSTSLPVSIRTWA